MISNDIMLNVVKPARKLLPNKKWAHLSNLRNKSDKYQNTLT